MPATRLSAGTGEHRLNVAPGVAARPAEQSGGALRGVTDFAVLMAVFVLTLAVFLFRQWKIAGTLGLSSFPLDDSWIHLQFARNLAEGQGFAYNPGGPVAGSTAPLWTLLLAGVFALFGSEPAWAKVIGVGATLGAVLLARSLARQWTENRALALVAGVAAAVAGPLCWGALSGMEVSLAMLLVTAALVSWTGGRDAATAVLLGLAVLARPESVLLIPLCWIARPITWRRTVIMFGAAAACVGPWALFNLAAAGTPLPATAAAKIEGGLVGFLSGIRESLATTLVGRPWRFEVEWVQWLWGINVFLPLLILLGLAMIWRRVGRRAALPATILLLHPLGMALLAPYRGPSFQEGRYSIHLLPLAITIAVVGLERLVRGRFGVVLVALFLAASVVAVPRAASRYAWAVQNIDAMQVRLGYWVLVHTPPEARLALNDVGAITYLSRRQVLDLMGLVTPAIIPYRREGEAGVLRYLERRCPDYLIIFPAWFPGLSAMSDRFTPIYRVRLAHNTVAGADEMVVYETIWNRWRRTALPCPEARRDHARLGSDLPIERRRGYAH